MLDLLPSVRWTRTNITSIDRKSGDPVPSDGAFLNIHIDINTAWEKFYSDSVAKMCRKKGTANWRERNAEKGSWTETRATLRVTLSPKLSYDSMVEKEKEAIR